MYPSCLRADICIFIQLSCSKINIHLYQGGLEVVCLSFCHYCCLSVECTTTVFIAAPCRNSGESLSIMQQLVCLNRMHERCNAVEQRYFVINSIETACKVTCSRADVERGADTGGVGVLTPLPSQQQTCASLIYTTQQSYPANFRLLFSV
jgi:hypothetical protein